MTEPLATKTAIFDVAVIGAGVVGCAMARRFALEGARVVLLEKSTDILSGASKGNSAILHTGFDAPPGSIELASTSREGYREYRDIHAPQPAAAGNRRPGGGMERRGSGAHAGYRRAGPRQQCR